jgi:flagellar basal-body rod modification protein FlgD
VTTPINGAYNSVPPAQVQSPKGADEDMFMKLLVAQLKYQNPSQATDSSQYMSQMALFTQVEKLTALVDAQKAQQSAQDRLAAEALVGKKVTGIDAAGDTRNGVVTQVAFGSGTPTLTLADGSTLAATDVSTVEQS